MVELSGRLSAEGFTAVAWDPFSAFDSDLPSPQRVEIARALVDTEALSEQQQWLSYMQEELDLRAIGVVGFCLGGRQALSLSASDERLRACVSYHPTIPDPLPAHFLDAVGRAPAIPCAVQLLLPGHDHITSHDTVRALRSSLEGRNAPTMTHLYPTAEHGFAVRYHPINGADLMAVPANREAFALGWPQTVAFLRACLG